MLEIESLYGVEVIVHFEALGQRKSPGGVLLPQLKPDWMEATVIAVGSECKKGLKVGDCVVINKQIYNESPVLSSNQFKFPAMPKGEFKIMTEYLIAMKVKSDRILDVAFEEQPQEPSIEDVLSAIDKRHQTNISEPLYTNKDISE